MDGVKKLAGLSMLLAAVGGTAMVRASTVTVVNPDFETVQTSSVDATPVTTYMGDFSPASGTHGFGSTQIANIRISPPAPATDPGTRNVYIPGWNNEAGQAGIEKIGQFSFGFTGNDTFVGYVGAFGSTGAASITQTLSETLPTTGTYTLSIEVWRRKDQTSLQTSPGTPIAGFPNFTATLNAGSGTPAPLIPAGPASYTIPAAGSSAIYSVQYDAATNVASLGQPLVIRLADNGDQANFDNLSLTYTPEPSSLAAIGLGALMLLRRSRRQAFHP